MPLAPAARVHALLDGRMRLEAVVLPGLELIPAGLGVPPGEEAVEVLGVAVAFVDDDGSVRVVLDVLREVELVLEDVVDQPTEEGDVRAGTDADEPGRHRARAGEAGVDVDDLRPP